MALRFANVLVQKFRAFDVQKETLRFSDTGLFGDLLGQGVGHRLGDESLAASGRAIQQGSFRGPELMLFEEFGVHVGQFHRVSDRFDLAEQPTDLLVSDVGNFLENQFFHLGAWHLLNHVAAADVTQQRVPCAQSDSGNRPRETNDPLFIGVRHNDAPVIAEHLLKRDDLTDDLVVALADNVHRFVEHDLLACDQAIDPHARADSDPHLASRGHDVH